MNRQVPKKIAIIGNGKVARHMVQYFELLGQPYTHWFRHSIPVQNNVTSSKLAHFKQKLKKLIQPKLRPSLSNTVADVDVVLLLIPDDHVEQFVLNNQELKNKQCIHFSGSLNTDLAAGCHPLMTFGAELYDLDLYARVPFVVDEGVDFRSLLPRLNNPIHVIKAEDKAKYHAYCVMAGNFTQMLWKAIGQELEHLDLPKDLMSLYLQQNTHNFINDSSTSATGPFVRGDYATIEKHQLALKNHQLEKVYQTFYDLHLLPEMEEKRRQS